VAKKNKMRIAVGKEGSGKNPANPDPILTGEISFPTRALKLSTAEYKFFSEKFLETSEEF
jgi:hypothetical protein